MQTTANYDLKKPEGNDTVDIDVINENMDMVDGELKKLSSAMGDDPDFKTTLSGAISAKANQADFNNHVNALTAHGIGDRTQLKTAAKDTIVNALNELKTAIPSVPVQSVNGKTGSVSLGASDITVADSSNHFSSNPKNVENVLAELFTSGTNGKNDIYNAISAKGTTPASKNFTDLVSAIGNISTGKKFASGSLPHLTTAIKDYSVYQTVSGLSFKPSFVFLYTSDFYKTWTDSCGQVSAVNGTLTGDIAYFSGGNGANVYKTKVISLLSDGFNVWHYRETADQYYIDIPFGARTINWVAIE